jgi:phage-related protein
MHITLIDSGPAYSLYGLVINNKCLIWEFINSLSGKDLTQIGALLNRILKNGPPVNERKFRNVGKKIYELKTPSGIRILCFKGGPNLENSLILTQAGRKIAKKKFQREIKKASKWQKEFFNRGDISIIEGI